MSEMGVESRTFPQLTAHGELSATKIADDAPSSALATMALDIDAIVGAASRQLAIPVGSGDMLW